MSLQVQMINKRLIKKYGRNDYKNANFRIVFSDFEREKRDGVYNEFYGDLFLRTSYGVHVSKKYSYINEKWILEQWQQGDKPKELVDAKNGSYEPIFVFQDANFHSLPLRWDVCDKIIWNIFNPMNIAKRRAIQQEDEQRAINNEYLKDLEGFGGHVGWTEDRLHTGNAISMAGLNAKKLFIP